MLTFKWTCADNVTSSQCVSGLTSAVPIYEPSVAICEPLSHSRSSMLTRIGTSVEPVVPPSSRHQMLQSGVLTQCIWSDAYMRQR